MPAQARCCSACARRWWRSTSTWTPTGSRSRREIAKVVRQSSGGLPGVQAIGLVLASTGRAQVSMNLIDIEATPLWRMVSEVKRLAHRRGVEVAGSELVGLMPASVAWSSAAHALHLPGASPDRVLEVSVAGQFADG